MAQNQHWFLKTGRFFMLQINMFIRKFYACKCQTMEVGNEADMVNKCINARFWISV